MIDADVGEEVGRPLVLRREVGVGGERRGRVEDEGEVAELDVGAQPRPVDLDARVEIARLADLRGGAAGDLRVLERLPEDGRLGRDQPGQAARVLLPGEHVVGALRVVLVELVVDRRGHRLAVVNRDLQRGAVQPDLLADDVLQLVAAAVEVAAVGLDAQHLGDVDPGAGQEGEDGLFFRGGAVEHHGRLGADEEVGRPLVELQLDAGHRRAASLVLGRAAPAEAVAVAEPHAVARGREGGEGDELLLLAGGVEPAGDPDVRAGVAEVDGALGEVVDAQDQRALHLPLVLVVVLVEDRMRQRLVAGEARVVVVEEERAERVGPPEAPAGHARDGLARLGEDVLVGEREVEADVHETGLAAGAPLDVLARLGGRGGARLGRDLRRRGRVGRDLRRHRRVGRRGRAGLTRLGALSRHRLPGARLLGGRLGRRLRLRRLGAGGEREREDDERYGERWPGSHGLLPHGSSMSAIERGYRIQTLKLPMFTGRRVPTTRGITMPT